MAADFFMKIAGIAKGESQDSVLKGSEGWYQIQHYSFGGSNAATVTQGTGIGAGKVNLQDIQIVKYLDTASCALLLSMSNGSHYATVNIVARKSGGKVPVDYLTITLTDVMVTSYSHSGSDENPSESVTLAYTKIKVDYNAQDEKGVKQVAGTYNWDLKSNATK